MVAQMIGSNPEELVALAQVMRRSSRRLDSAWQDIDSLMGTLPWQGPSAEVFRNDWGRHRRALADAVMLLERASATLTCNADEQVRASHAARGPVRGGPGQGQGSGGPAPRCRRPRQMASTTTRHGLDDYTAQAYENAKIDPGLWAPEGGLDANRETIEAVYEYYAQLYRDHPEMQWAGMAALIGPSFLAGFMDLDSFADMAGFARQFYDNPPSLPPGITLDDVFPPGVGPSMRELASMSAEQIEEEFRYYERTFLRMQREIFLDLAPLHEAWASDGLGGIAALYKNDDIDRSTFEAWQLIDEGQRTGNTDLIRQGNEALLLREQQVVIADEYNQMYSRARTGPAVTYLMTQVGEPSIPGAQGYADVFPWQAKFEIDDELYIEAPRKLPFVELPRVGMSTKGKVTATVTTPFADGNIARCEDRWNLIQKDTLPAYNNLSREEVLKVLDTPIGDRADELTTRNRIDGIVHHLLTDWSIQWDAHREIDFHVTEP